MTFREFLHSKKYDKDEITTIISDLRSKKDELPKEVALAVEYATTFSAFTTIPLEKRAGRIQECARLYNNLSAQTPEMKKSEKIKIIAKELHVNTDCIRVYLRELDEK